MFKKASEFKNRIRRTKAVAVKTLFRIEVRKVIFPKFKQTSLTAESEVSVCFERGGKIAASHDRGLINQRNGSAEVIFNETLSLVVTMYKGTNGKFQDKCGKLIIRQKRRGLVGADYKGLGVAEVDLARAVGDNCAACLVLPVDQCAATGAEVHVTVTPKIVGEEANEDMSDNLSQHSDFSDSGNSAVQVDGTASLALDIDICADFGGGGGGGATAAGDTGGESVGRTGPARRPYSMGTGQVQDVNDSTSSAAGGPTLASRLVAALSANAALTTALEEARLLNEHAVTENESLRAENMEIVLKLQEKTIELEDRLASAQVELDESREYVHSLAERNTSLADQLDGMSDKGSAAAAQKSDLLLEVYADLNRTTAEKSELSSRVEELEVQLHEARQLQGHMTTSAPVDDSNAVGSGVPLTPVEMLAMSAAEHNKRDRELAALRVQLKKYKENERRCEETIHREAVEKESLLSTRLKLESEVRLGKDRIQKLKIALIAARQELSELKESVGGLEGIDSYRDVLESRNALERELTALREESVLKLKEHKSISAHVMSLMSEKFDMQQLLDTLRKSLALADADKTESKREISLLKDEIERSGRLISRLQEELGALSEVREEKFRVEKQIASIQDEKNRLVNKFLGLHNENSELKQKVHILQAEQNRSQKTLQSLSDSLENVESKLESTEIDRFALAEQLERSFGKEIVEELREETTRLTAAVEEAERINSALHSRNIHLEAKLVEVENTVLEVTADTNASRSEKSALVQQLSVFQEQLKVARDERSGAEKRYAELNGEVDALRSSIRDLQANATSSRNKSDVEAENSDLRQHIATLDSAALQSVAVVTSLKADKARLQTGVSSLQQFIDDERRGHAEGTEELDRVKKAYVLLEGELRQTKDEVHSLRKKLHRLDDMDSAALRDVKEIKQLTTDVHRLQCDVAAMDQALQKETEQNICLREELRMCDFAKTQSDDRVVALEGQTMLLEESNARLTDESADHNHQLVALRANTELLEKGLNTLRTERQSHTKLVELLQTDLKKSETALGHLRSDNDVLHNKVLRLEDELFAAQSKLEPMKSEFSRAEKSIAFLTDDKRKLQHSVTALREDRYRLEERLLAVEEEKGNLEAEVAALADERTGLQQALDEKLDELRGMMQRRVSIEGAHEAMEVAVSVEKRIKEVLVEDRKRLQECVNVLEAEKEELLEDIEVFKDDVTALNRELTTFKAAQIQWQKDMDLVRLEVKDKESTNEALARDFAGQRAEMEQLQADHSKLEEFVRQYTLQTSSGAATIIPTLSPYKGSDDGQLSSAGSNVGSLQDDNTERVKRESKFAKQRRTSLLPAETYTTPEGGAVEPSSDIYVGMIQLSDELVAARSTIMSLQDQIASLTEDMAIQVRQQNSLAQAQERAEASRDEFVSRMDTLLSHIVSLEKEVDDKSAEIARLHSALHDYRSASSRSCQACDKGGTISESGGIDMLDELIHKEEIESLKDIIAQKDCQIRNLCLSGTITSGHDSLPALPSCHRHADRPGGSYSNKTQIAYTRSVSSAPSSGPGDDVDDEVDRLVRESRGGVSFGFTASPDTLASREALHSDVVGCSRLAEHDLSGQYHHNIDSCKVKAAAVTESSPDDRFTLGIRDSQDISEVPWCEYNEVADEDDAGVFDEQELQKTTMTAPTSGADSDAMNSIIADLISAKLDAASLATECDAERKKVSLLKTRVKWYEEKVAKADQVTAELKKAREDIAALTQTVASKDFYISKFISKCSPGKAATGHVVGDPDDSMISIVTYTSGDADVSMNAVSGGRQDEIDALVRESRGGIRSYSQEISTAQLPPDASSNNVREVSAVIAAIPSTDVMLRDGEAPTDDKDFACRLSLSLRESSLIAPHLNGSGIVVDSFSCGEYNEEEDDVDGTHADFLMDIAAAPACAEYGRHHAAIGTRTYGWDAAEETKYQEHIEDLEREVHDLVEALITAKVEYASASTECDAERKKVTLLRARVQKYASKMASLEVTNAELTSRLHSFEMGRQLSSSGSFVGSRGRGDVLCSGILTKRGSRFPSWLKRFFELTPYGLCYYEVNDGICKGEFLITPTTILQEKSFLMHQHCFSLQSNRRVLYLTAESEKDKREWMRALTEVIGKLATGGKQKI